MGRAQKRKSTSIYAKAKNDDSAKRTKTGNKKSVTEEDNDSSNSVQLSNSKDKNDDGAKRTKNVNRKSVTEDNSSNTVQLSQEQLTLITSTVTKNLLEQLKNCENPKKQNSVDICTVTSQSTDDPDIAIPGTSTDLESVLPITAGRVTNELIGNDSQSESTEIMPATAAQLPQPLGLHVDLTLKTKIWSNQFVDLCLLLSRRTTQSYNIQLQDNQLTMVPKKKVFQLNIEQWNQAFTIYMSIYVEKFPNQAANMLQYIGHIQEMAQESGEVAARHYDETFRKWRQTTPLPWNVINQSLHGKALALALKQKVMPNRFESNTFSNRLESNTFSQGQGFSKKPCFFYRKKGFCKKESCPFKHFCEQCRTVHTNRICPVRSGQKSSQSTYKKQQGLKSQPQTSSLNK